MPPRKSWGDSPNLNVRLLRIEKEQRNQKALLARLLSLGDAVAAGVLDIATAIRESKSGEITPEMMATIKKIAEQNKVNQEALAEGAKEPEI